MDQGNKGGFRLKWPWNWVVCGLIIIAGWWFIGIFSAALAALFFWWQKKKYPDAIPQGGYCLDRTRKRLARLLWSFLYLLLAAGCGVVFFMGLREDKSAWESKDWAIEIISGGGFAVFMVCFVIETYTDLRDAFFPAKSRLAKSIRSQLPYPDEAPPVEELFAMVDKDIQENGQWFDRVAIGREWVLGDDVSSIARIRGVFARDEIVIHHSGKRRQSTRVLELHIVDDRKQVQRTDLRNPSELQAAVNCLRLRAPEARFGDHRNISSFLDQSEEEWQAFNRSVANQRAQRLARQEGEQAGRTGSNDQFVLIDANGQRTSRFDRRTVAEEIANLKQPGQGFTLEPTEVIPMPGLAGIALSRLSAGITNQGLTLVITLKASAEPYTTQVVYKTLAKPVSEQEARQAFFDLLERRQPPAFAQGTDWQPFQAGQENRRPAASNAKLILSDRSGADRTYTTFTRRDVELAGEGLSGGKYTVVCLFAGPRYLYLKAGDQSDGRITVNASRPDPDKLRVFETKCTDRQAQEWLLQMADGTFNPSLSQWKDITRQLEKQSRK